MDSLSFFKLPLYIKVCHERWLPDRESNPGPHMTGGDLKSFHIARRGFVDLYFNGDELAVIFHIYRGSFKKLNESI